MSELHLPEVPIPMFEDENQQVVIDLSNNAVNEEALVEIARHAEEVVLKGSQKKSKNSSLLDGRKQVVLSNQFVVGTESGTMFAFRIIRIAAAQIPRGAKEFPDVYISADDMEKLGYSRQRLTSHMRDIVNEIMDYRIRVAAYDKDTNECMQLSAVNVFSKCSAHARQGAMTVKLNPDIADYFLNQRRNYTKYNLAIAASVNSYPAAKLHEVLICRTRQYGVNLLRFSIDELRVLLTPMSKAAEKGKKRSQRPQKKSAVASTGRATVSLPTMSSRMLWRPSTKAQSAKCISVPSAVDAMLSPFVSTLMTIRASKIRKRPFFCEKSSAGQQATLSASVRFSIQARARFARKKSFRDSPHQVKIEKREIVIERKYASCRRACSSRGTADRTNARCHNGGCHRGAAAGH